MKMDKKELRFMNSYFRQFFLKYYEFKVFKKFLKKNHIDLNKKVILDAGCGCGYSTELIIKEFQPEEIFAFDIAPNQIELTKQRKLSVNLFVGSMTDIKIPSEKFDAIFIFGVLHHVPEWRRALKEVNRMLKPGGVLLVEEPNKRTLDRAERYWKIYHPKESRFKWPEFIKGLEDNEFHVVENKKIYADRLRSFMCIKLNINSR